MENQNNVVEEVKTEGGAVETEKVNEVVKEEKTFTQADLDKILNKKFAQWQKKTEEAKAEAERLAKMSAEEKAKHELDKKIAELEAREKEIAKKELENETSKQLRDLGISSKATRFVLGQDAEVTHSNIKEFELFINELKEDIKRELLRGKTPKASIVQGNSITKEQFKKMDLVQRQKLFMENRELYNELTK